MFLSCPALEAVDRAQVRKAKSPEDKAAREKGLSPERGRFWFSETPDERAAREWLESHTD